jgi:phenylacetic acid degradation operon negative regulatory protein
MATPDPLAQLRAYGDLRIWSVVITFFGDSVHPRDAWVPATALAEIAEALGIAPAALRVALHRLVRDGWLQRERRGRRSYYALSPDGLASFGPATRRIYARAPALTGPWRLAAAAPGLGSAARSALDAEMTNAGYLVAGPGLWLGHAGSGPPPAEVAEVTGAMGAVPDWLRAIFGPGALATDYARLEAGLAALETGLGALGPDRAIAARTLVVHHWRRLLLRHPDLPEAFFPRGWAGERCRSKVLALHQALSPAADAWIACALDAQERHALK